MRFLISVFFLVSLCIPANAQTYMEYFDRATQCEEQDSLLQAEKHYIQAIRMNPKDPRNALLYANVARLQRRQNRLEDALTAYHFSLNLMPENVPVLLDRAELYMEMGKEEAALDDYTTVIDVDSLHEKALLMRSFLYYQKQLYEEAEKDYLRLTRYHPSDTMALMGLAVLYQSWEKFDKAVAIWDRMLVLHPDKAAWYLYRAEAKRENGNYEAALPDIDKYMSLADASADVWIMRGDLSLALGKKTQARNDYQRAMDRGKSHQELRERLKKTQ